MQHFTCTSNSVASASTAIIVTSTNKNFWNPVNALAMESSHAQGEQYKQLMLIFQLKHRMRENSPRLSGSMA